MTVIAEFSIDADEFVLGKVLRGSGARTVEIERVIPATRRVMPYIWVEVEESAPFERLVEESPNVVDIARLDRIDGRSLYRVDWDERVQSLIYGMAATEATILEASGGQEWQFRIRFADHENLREFNEYCRTNGIEFRLRRVYTLADEADDDALGLTEQQREALQAAFEQGYFEVPRRATLSDLADTLGISQQATSERIRRGVSQVLADSLTSKQVVRRDG